MFLILFENLIDNFKKILIDSLKIFWLIRTDSFRFFWTYIHPCLKVLLSSTFKLALFIPKCPGLMFYIFSDPPLLWYILYMLFFECIFVHEWQRYEGEHQSQSSREPADHLFQFHSFVKIVICHKLPRKKTPLIV